MQLQVSDELNLVIKYAREEAMRTGSYGIGPDHLFLGLIRQEENAAFRILQNLGVEPAELKAFIDQRIFTNETIPYDQIDHINFSRQAQNVLSITVMEATRLKSPKAETHHLLLALCRTTESYGQAYLRARGIDYGRLLAVMEDEGLLKPLDQQGNPDGNTQPSQGPEDDPDENKKLDIEEFAYDLTRAAIEGKLDPVVGRDVEISRVIQILGRRKKNNPMLIGEPGVGKSAIVEGIAQKIASGNISAALAKKRILSLDIASVVAGTIALAIIAVPVNAFITLPLYASAMGFSTEAIIGMCTSVNPLVKDKLSLLLAVFVPFNLIKGFGVGLWAFLIYLPLKNFVNRIYDRTHKKA